MSWSTLVCTIAFCASAALGQSLVIEGIDGKSVTLNVEDLAKMPRQSVEVKDHGKPALFNGVALGDILAKVERPIGEKYHSTSARTYMVVEARDGYRAVYAWAELDPGFMDKPITLATMRDGKPLDEKSGPFQLVAPGEKRAGRWVRQITALRLRIAQ